MSERIATTPFGGGRFSAALFQAQQNFEARREALKTSHRDGANFSGAVDKWQLLRALTEARHGFALSDRSLAVLEALMSFHPDKELDGKKDLIVFPSNEELSIRCRGMSAPSLRRHIAALVQAGMLLRRDSPNGKRFARKGRGGEIQEAFGFNLAPVVLQAPEIFEAAEHVRAHAAAVRKVRGEITLHLRDISKMIAAAYEDGQAVRQPRLWEGFIEDLRGLSGKVSRTAPLEEHERRCAALLRLRAEVESAFLEGMSETDLQAGEELDRRAREEPQNTEANELNKNMNGNDAHNERHIQNSNKDDSFEIGSDKVEAKGTHQTGRLAGGDPVTRGSEAGSRKADQAQPEARTDAQQEAVSLGDLKQSCPEFTQYAVNGLNSWRDARDAAELARPMLGISRDAWTRAVAAMGPGGSVVTIAYLIERALDIKSPGGYLRALTEKAEGGKFRMRPMLDSLKNRE